jgi:uncharacterized phage protein gp47/JayE
MPLTLRPKDAVLESLLASLLAGNIVTDISHISVLRQLCEGLAATQADLAYDLYTLLQGFYLASAEGVDLDVRGADHGLARDPGQAASDPVVFTKHTAWVDDIPLPAPQVVRATLADGTEVLYRSLGDRALLPSGRSVSGPGPATVVTSGVNDHLDVNLDGDGVRTLLLGTLTSPTQIAAAIQAAVQALAPLDPVHLPAYATFRCDYSVTNAGAYTLRAGTAGQTSSVVVTVSAALDASHALKLGVTQGGRERVGEGSVAVPVRCDVVGVLGNVGAGHINQVVSAVPGISAVANPLAFANGRAPASDDAYRQDIRTYLLALGRGTRDAVERAVAQTVSADGQHHVMSSQVVYGVSTIQVYVCDGRSLTEGAQSDIIQAVQDELDGLGQEPGGWEPAGNTAGVASATILPLPIAVTVLLGPTPDLASAQRALQNAIYHTLYTWPVGAALSYAQLTAVIDATVAEVFDVLFTQPGAFSTTPTTPVGGGLGQKIMPSTLSVVVQRA